MTYTCCLLIDSTEQEKATSFKIHVMQKRKISAWGKKKLAIFLPKVILISQFLSNQKHRKYVQVATWFIESWAMTVIPLFSVNDCYSWHQIQCLEDCSYGVVP